jgi:protein-tyrosine phosphatase
MDRPRYPDCYWVEPGRLLAGEYPGALDTNSARRKICDLLDSGIRTFVDLTEPFELQDYEEVLRREAEARGIEVDYFRMSIPDLGVPSRDFMLKILETIREAVEDARPVYVHCWGGIGRTGTVVGCWLIERGCEPGDALGTLDCLREECAKSQRPSPETAVQLRFVRDWGKG